MPIFPASVLRSDRRKDCTASGVMSDNMAKLQPAMIRRMRLIVKLHVLAGMILQSFLELRQVIGNRRLSLGTHGVARPTQSRPCRQNTRARQRFAAQHRRTGREDQSPQGGAQHRSHATAHPAETDFRRGTRNRPHPPPDRSEFSFRRSDSSRRSHTGGGDFSFGRTNARSHC